MVSGTHIAEITPNRDSEKPKLGTIPGITSWNKWKWPDDENESGFICTRGLPATSSHSIPTKLWTTPIPDSTNSILKNKSNFDPFYTKYGTSTCRLNERTVTRWSNILYKQMYQELQERLNKGELEPEEVPRLSTVQN
ncbi:hypothetical protein C2G38_2213513 [Gigaspora rosea]|uniref:Uncharacterized protein n=1 Tax=Gigaspora rosea TaxID=44941 RepID=A0A397UK53_9GLOM|nr:hypothetical protein C2G38_2213513 [Gigaspora rosea]